MLARITAMTSRHLRRSIGVSSHRVSSVHVPAAKKGHIGFTILGSVSRLPCIAAAPRVAGIDVRKGAGNFLKGATPSQDMMGGFVGIAKVRMG